METIQLDNNIRSYVLIPIFVVILLASFLRINIMQILKTDTKVVLKDLKNSQMIARALLLRTNGNYLPEKSFRGRKLFFNKKGTGYFWNPPSQPNALQAIAQAQTDPSAVMGMMKNQFAFLFLSGGLAYFISFLFPGFLVAKAPFPLSYRFKSMLQRGIDVPSLDVTYVSSLSWYFFVLFGSNGLMSILTYLRDPDKTAGEGTDIDLSNPMMQMNPAANPMLPGLGAPDLKKVFQQERESLDVTNHEFSLANIEYGLINNT